MSNHNNKFQPAVTMMLAPSIALLAIALSGCGCNQNRADVSMMEDKERTIAEMKVRAIAHSVAAADLATGAVKYAHQWNDDAHTAELKKRMKEKSVQLIFLGTRPIYDLENIYWSAYNAAVEKGFNVVDLRAEFAQFAKSPPLWVEPNTEK